MGGTSEPTGRRMVTFLVCVPLLVLGLTSCGTTSELGSAPSKPVTAPGGPEIEVEAGRDVPIRASAKGAERYIWELEGEGAISAPTGEAIIFTPPEHEGTARLNVMASNKYGDSPKASLTISILAEASVRLDTIAIPAGLMSSTDQPGHFISIENERDGCRLAQPCLQFTYRPGGQWGGIVWWPHRCGTSGTPAAWGSVKSGDCGFNVPQAGSLKAVNHLTFLARGERGGEIIEFKVGANDVAPKPGKSTGRITLTPNWTRYEIDLRGVDLSNAIGLFLWIATDRDNPQGATFHLDDIKFEGVK
jgi:hypothetical protein